MFACVNTLIVPFLEFKVDDSEPGSFTGYGSTFGNVDLGKDICAKGCFKRTLDEMGKQGAQPAMYWMHDRKLPIGDWLETSEDSKGLKMKGRIWVGKGIPEAERAYMMLKGTGPKGLSIGFVPKLSEYDDKKGIRTLKDVDLPEVSVVGYGMNPKALVTSIKSHITDGLVPTIRDLEALLRDAGMTEKQAKALLSKGYDGLTRDESPGVSSEVYQKALADIQRLFHSDRC